MKTPFQVLFWTLAVCFSASLCMADIATTAPSSKQRSKAELIDEMKRIEAEIWSLSSACAGETAVAPLQTRYDALLDQFRLLPTEPDRNPANPLDQGGEHCGNATVIQQIPFCDTGTTVGYNDDMAPSCHLSEPTAPDVVYSFTPSTVMAVDVSLCGSAFNTFLYIWVGGCGVFGSSEVCCNDDSPQCAPASCCNGVMLYPGFTYYFIVDGFGNQSGQYLLTIDYAVEPPACVIPSVCSGCVTCPADAQHENEPCPATYPDVNSPACTGGHENIACGQTVCGNITNPGPPGMVDVDGYEITVTTRTRIRSCIVAEFPVVLYLHQYTPG